MYAKYGDIYYTLFGKDFLNDKIHFTPRHVDLDHYKLKFKLDGLKMRASSLNGGSIEMKPTDDNYVLFVSNFDMIMPSLHQNGSYTVYTQDAKCMYPFNHPLRRRKTSDAYFF